MLKKDAEIKWIHEEKESFENIKQALIRALVLIGPNHSKEFLIFSFSSEDTVNSQSKTVFRLNFVGDIISYWSHAQLVFCFYISIKFLILGLFKG
jgi:hypothetical protein